MYFKISRNELQNAMSIVSKAISSNSPIPSLMGIKFDVYSDRLELIGSDYNFTIKNTIKKSDDFVYEVYREGSVVINRNYINEIVRKIDNDIIEFEIMDGFLTRISGNQAEFNINGISPSEYPLIDLSRPQKEFFIDTNHLITTINQTHFAASIKETRPALTGINLNCEEGKLKCVATDSFRLAKKEISIDCEYPFNITIPSKSMLEISKIIEPNNTIVIALSEKKAQFICKDIIIETRIIDESYPDTSRLVPSVFEHELIIDIKELLIAIDRQSLIKNESDTFSIIKLSMNNSEVIMSSKSQEIGYSKEKLNFTSYTGDLLELSFSSKYMIDALKGITGTTAKISFCGEMKPFVISSSEDNSTLQLVLPVRTFS